MLQPDPDEVIETTRLDRLRTLRQSVPQGLPEAAHSVSVLLKAVDDHLAGHPTIAANPELYRLTYRAFENLFTLHQALSR
ncbi:hypothetical protein [Microvirga aerophila]|uniref:Uncharacterized protein n=1 Tax=Microvirga aerophila TaxID=670291 RepID=A0A512C5G6_9HYPH|nr:hypothetical protein [Microvirga aerophila]GEO19463.1 hypothetical protein MAE02_71590 [Microvirga aerophila]